jgi:hypothetical protein
MSIDFNWVSVDEELPPKKGRYAVLLIFDKGEMLVERLYCGKGVWMGGCRPFSESEKVIKWRRKDD